MNRHAEREVSSSLRLALWNEVDDEVALAAVAPPHLIFVRLGDLPVVDTEPTSGLACAHPADELSRSEFPCLIMIHTS